MQTMLGNTKQCVFQNSSSRKKKHQFSKASEKPLVLCGAVPVPGAWIPQPVQQLAELSVPRSAVLGAAAAGGGGRPTWEGPNPPRTFPSLFFIERVCSQDSAGAKHLRHKGSRKRGQVCNFPPPRFGTEFCSWLKFFSFQNTSGHFS